MCGIVGIYNFHTNAPINRMALARMTRLLAHRGPDDAGRYVDSSLGLGHRRLSILDLSARGHQPMASANGRYVIVYNGEVYNYLELRQELASQGYPFRTSTDTEVILALFSRFGAASLQRLNGMFAFAIWDTLERRLFLARDRVGIKPLYYAETPDGIVFASEAKALFASQQLKPQVALSGLDMYLRVGYVPGGKTLFQDVYKLLPGHWLQASPTGLTSEAYWDVQYAPNYQRTPAETAEELRELLRHAMQLHLRSDVPVGVFLSGGLDSSTTVALLAEAGCHHLKTFSVAYKAGQAYDETPYARLVAERFHTEHHTLYVEPAQFLEFIPQYVWYMDEPVAESAALSLYFIARLLREHATVALSGEGADELFAGYDIYRYMQWIEAYRTLPEVVRRRILHPIFAALGNEKIGKYLRLAHKPLEERYLGVSLSDCSYQDLLYTDELRTMLRPHLARNPLGEYYARTHGDDLLSRMLYTDLKTWLVDDLLIKADKMTMANSVELRVPFLDYRIVEYAATIPSAMKLRRGQAKWILKQAVHDRLPREILRRKKRGFPTPLAIMLQNDLSNYLPDLLLSSQCLDRLYFKRQTVERIVHEHCNQQRDHHNLLWKLIVLEEWHRQFIDGNNSF